METIYDTLNKEEKEHNAILIKYKNIVANYNLLTKKNLILFLDIETSGLPIKKSYDKYYSYKDLDKYNMSRIVQISWIICEKNGNRIVERNFIVKPDGFNIPKDASEIHGITTEYALKNGIDITNVFDIFIRNDIKNITHVVAHNILFDSHILLSEMFRYGYQTIIDNIIKKCLICTGHSSTKLLKIPLGNIYKMPSLEELYKWCFNEDIENLHNSEYDVENLYKIFFKMIKITNKFVKVKINSS